MSTAESASTCDKNCTTHDVTVLNPGRRKQLNERAKKLAQGLVLYNVIEGVVSIASGMASDSTALVGFGLDSAVEVLSGLVIIWQFKHANPQEYERKAQRLIAVAFFVLAAYVGTESILAIVEGQKAAPSPVGIAIALLSVIIMPTVSFVQRRTGKELGSAAVVADSKQVLLCAAMSLTLLVGLVVNAAWGWWWLDPVVGIGIALLALKEGYEALKGETCGCTAGLAQ